MADQISGSLPPFFIDIVAPEHETYRSMSLLCNKPLASGSRADTVCGPKIGIGSEGNEIEINLSREYAMKNMSLKTQVCAVLLVGICAGHASSAFADELTIDGGHSSVLFRVMHKNTAPFYGRFNDVSGTFTLADNPADSSFDVVIKTESVDTNNKKRDGHLKSPDFFNAREFPTISFKSTKVEKGEKDTLKVTGDLTCHGVTKSITIDVVQTGAASGPQGESKGIEAIFTIKRSEFGMEYGLEALGDDVRVIVALEGGKRG